MGWSLSRDHATQRISRQLLWIGTWRILWAFIAFQTYGQATIIGVIVLARSISNVRALALDNPISMQDSQPGIPYQPITMGPEGLMVGSVEGERAAGLLIGSVQQHQPAHERIMKDRG